MDDETSLHTGRLAATLNRAKTRGDKQPLFRGIVHFGDNERASHEVALWANKTQKGHIILSGETKESAASQIAAIVDDLPELPENYEADKTALDRTLEPGAILLFENTHKKSDRSPDYWGYYNAGAAHPLLALNLWAGKDANDNLTLSGTFEPHKPREPQQTQNAETPAPEATEEEAPARSRKLRR